MTPRPVLLLLGLCAGACGPAELLLWSATTPNALFSQRCADGRQPTFIYADADGDGFGSGAPLRQGCLEVPSEVLQAGDCDDGDPQIRPGAPERCNLIDDDCDPDTVDEDHAITGGVPYEQLDAAIARAGSGRVELCGGAFTLIGAVAPGGRSLVIEGVHPDRPSTIEGADQVVLMQGSRAPITLRRLQLSSGLFPDVDVTLDRVTLSGNVRHALGGAHRWTDVHVAAGADVWFRGGSFVADGLTSTGASRLQLDGSRITLRDASLFGGADANTRLLLGSRNRPSSIEVERADLLGVDLEVHGHVRWLGGGLRDGDVWLDLRSDSTFGGAALTGSPGRSLEIESYPEPIRIEGLRAEGFTTTAIRGVPVPPSFERAELTGEAISIEGPGVVGFDDGVIGGLGTDSAPVRLRDVRLEIRGGQLVGAGGGSEGVVHLLDGAGGASLELSDVQLLPEDPSAPLITGPGWAWPDAESVPASVGRIACEVETGCGL